MSSHQEFVEVLNRTRSTILATRCRVASSLISRTVGLLGKSSLEDGEALWIHRCGAIHMFGMRFAIDVVFLDASHNVVGIAENVRPNRMRVCPRARARSRAVSTVELAVGAIAASRTELGDRIEFVPGDLHE